MSANCRICLCAISLSFSAARPLSAVEVGNSFCEVVEEKGQPQSMKLEDGETSLGFADGTLVVLRKGRVVQVYEKGSEPPPKPPRPTSPPTIYIVPPNGQLPSGVYEKSKRELDSTGRTSAAADQRRELWKDEHRLEHIGYSLLVGLVSLVLLYRTFFRNLSELGEAVSENLQILQQEDDPDDDLFFIYGELRKATFSPIKFFLWAGLSLGLAYGTYYLLQNFYLSKAVID